MDCGKSEHSILSESEAVVLFILVLGCHRTVVNLCPYKCVILSLYATYAVTVGALRHPALVESQGSDCLCLMLAR